MSPTTRSAEDDTVIAPLETTSPTTDRVPPPLSEIALPLAPPHPAWVSAHSAGRARGVRGRPRGGRPPPPPPPPPQDWGEGKCLPGAEPPSPPGGEAWGGGRA